MHFQKISGLGNQTSLQVALEFQVILILEGWRDAADCFETLLSMCVILCVCYIFVGVYLGVVFLFFEVYIWVFMGWGCLV